MSAEFHEPGAPRLPDPDAVSLIAALHSRAEDIRRAELSRAEGGWDSLCPGDRRRLEALTQSLVDALLVEPTARLQGDADLDAERIESARYLFGLDVQENDTAVPPPPVRRSALSRALAAGTPVFARTRLVEP